MALLPKVKLKALPTFPSNIIGGVGLTATKANGSLTLDYAWQEFGAINAIPTSPTSYILTYDTASGTYVMVPSHLLGGAVAGIADAPTDGVQYGRQGTTGSMNWTPVAGGAPANTAPIMDSGTTGTIGTSLLYARQDHIHPSDTTRLTDARSDGGLYGRQNGAWTAVPAPGISDAPSDGLQYGRQKSGTTMQWTAVSASGTTYVPIYDTRNAAIAATIPLGTTYIRINGYTTAGDGGTFDAVEISNSGTLQAWHFQTNAGARRWQIANTIINPRMFGGVGNGTNDDTNALQYCINMRAANGNVTIYIPPCPFNKTTGLWGAWRCISRLNIANSMVIHGDGMPGTYANTDPTGQPVYPRQPGSWILFDHLDVGFFVGSAADLSYVVFDGIGTVRNQPTPGASFTPINADYDFYCIGSDVAIINSMLLNPTNGVYFSSRSGRLTMNNVRGQPLNYGINIYQNFDVSRLIDIHWWIWWSGATPVYTYTRKNRTGLSTARADGLFVMNYMTIYDLICHHIYAVSSSDPGGANAGANSLIRAKFVNVYFDGCATGFSVDANCGGVIVEYVNLLAAYDPEADEPNAQLFNVGCNNAEIYIVNFEAVRSGASSLNVGGTGNHVAIHNARFRDWGWFGQAANSTPAIICGAGNYVKLTGDIACAPNYSTTIKAGAGVSNITGKLAEGYGAYTTASNGVVTLPHGARALPSHGIANIYGGFAGFTGVTVTGNAVDATNVIFSFADKGGVAAGPVSASFHWEVHI